MFSIFKRDETKLCIKCKHFDEPYICRRLVKPVMHLVHGETQSDGEEYAYSERASVFKCGPSGRFYEEKSE